MVSPFSGIVAQVGAFLHEFQTDTDRGTVIVGASYVDDLPAAMLQSYFVDDAKVVESLLALILIRPTTRNG